MGAWGFSMQSNAAARDAIASLWLLNNDGHINSRQVIKCQDARFIVNAFQQIKDDERMGFDAESGILGVADFLMKHGVNVRPARKFINWALESELKEDQLKTWSRPARRKEMLMNFKVRLNHRS